MQPFLVTSLALASALASSTMSNSPDPDEAEFDWLLKVDVSATIGQLTKILTECSASISTTPKQYDLFYCSQNQLDVIKVNAILGGGYKITSADINIKLSSKHPIQTIKTCIKETQNHPFCWRLHQIQDAMNHLSNAIDLLTSTPQLRMGPDNGHDFQSAEEVLQLINDVMNCLQKGRSSILIPKKSLIEELQHSQNMQSISPALPLDFSISFYVQAPNLVCSVYQLTQNNNRPQVKAEFQTEVSIPFLSEMLLSLGLGLQTCQQLKDKIQTFLNA